MSSPESLVLKYKAKKFEEIIGQKRVTVFLERMVKKDKVPSALIFAGHRGCGKTSLARIFSASLNCMEEQKPCGVCVPCKAILEGISPDVIESTAPREEDLTGLIESILYAPSYGYRVVIIEEADKIEEKVFSYLFKVLESLPNKTLFIFATSYISKIPESIIRRPYLYYFSKLSLTDTRTLLHTV